jgi:hypothetical protein
LPNIYVNEHLDYINIVYNEHMFILEMYLFFCCLFLFPVFLLLSNINLLY